MAERTLILIDKYGNPLGTASNPLYIEGIVAVSSFVNLTDVSVSSPASGDYIAYDYLTGKYVNRPVLGSGLGDVIGPNGATAGNFPVFDSTGKILGDSGYSGSSFGDVIHSGAVTSRAIVIFADTTGKVIACSDATIDSSGNLNMASHRVISIAEPVNASDAATKNYVDTYAMGLSWQLPVGGLS